MLIESKIKIGHNSMFNIPEANVKSAHLLIKVALGQSQSRRTVYSGKTFWCRLSDSSTDRLVVFVLPKWPHTNCVGTNRVELTELWLRFAYMSSNNVKNFFTPIQSHLMYY